MIVNRQIKILISTFIILSGLFIPVRGEESQESRKIEIRTIAILPYGIERKNHLSGIYYDIANLLAKEAGYQVNNLVYPYARIMFELKSGKTDMTIMFKYEELEDYVVYIAPLPSLKTVVIGLKGSSFDSVENLKGKKLAYLRGAKFSDAIDSDPDIISITTKDFVQAIKLLMVGRVDAIIGPMDPILSAAIQLEVGETLFGEPLVVSERTPWVQVSKKSLDRISVDKLRTLFEAFEKRGELEKIRQKYISSNKAESDK
ncbi:conserved hypothetical protein [Shewanella sediminis HAW-EB3]|uniref:Solute-binding protein family 3/N-terminal domain-containing protein n=1 Tax=Shewanella sediminis (strain HAW-EB3) TaxID=425104 RepID=A8FS35_SHESH|nr:transporter substrate-binding domain-containing protein [Shewanella sediminis]ABV35658.1 conserved hypothetical protein [Shewanella sediminis HAW-EB3]